MRRATPEAFSALLQEKLDELDQAAEHEALMEHDEVERLRLQAAYLISGTDGKPWHTGAAVHFQGERSELDDRLPTLDISYPARPNRRAPAGSPGPSEGAERAVTPLARQGRRIPG
jgi:hypothetical protein